MSIRTISGARSKEQRLKYKKYANYHTILTSILLILVWSATVTVIFYPPRWLPGAIKINDNISIPIETKRTYTQFNLTFSRLEAVANYLFASFNNKTGSSTSFMHTPPRQLLLAWRDAYSDLSVKEILDWNSYDPYATALAPHALLILNHTSLAHNKLFQKRFKAVFDRFIPGLVAFLRLPKGSAIYNIVGPADLWDYYLTLKAFNATALVPRENWLYITLNSLNDDGSFGNGGTGVASLEAIRSACYLLREFHALDLVNWTKVTEYVLSLQLDNGYFTLPLFYGLSVPSATIDTYCFLNATNQLNLINVTRMHEIFHEIYNYNLHSDDPDVFIMEKLADLAYYNGLDLHSYFPDIDSVLPAIISSQELFFGGFANSWSLDPSEPNIIKCSNVLDTYSVLWLFYVCHRFDLFSNSSITILYPPLSPYFDRLSGSSLSFLLSCSSFYSSALIFTLVYVLKRSRRSS